VITERLNFSTQRQHGKVHQFVKRIERLRCEIGVRRSDRQIFANVLHTSVPESMSINFDHTEAAFANSWKIGMFTQKGNVDVRSLTR
jgi:hypothetical protein